MKTTEYSFICNENEIDPKKRYPQLAEQAHFVPLTFGGDNYTLSISYQQFQKYQLFYSLYNANSELILINQNFTPALNINVTEYTPNHWEYTYNNDWMEASYIYKDMNEEVIYKPNLLIYPLKDVELFWIKEKNIIVLNDYTVT